MERIKKGTFTGKWEERGDPNVRKLMSVHLQEDTRIAPESEGAREQGEDKEHLAPDSLRGAKEKYQRKAGRTRGANRKGRGSCGGMLIKAFQRGEPIKRDGMWNINGTIREKRVERGKERIKP